MGEIPECGQAEHVGYLVLTSSRTASDYDQLIADSPARGFLAKQELSGAVIAALIAPTPLTA